MYHILELLQSSKIITSLEILNLVDEDDIQVLSIKAILSDGSLFYIRELTTKTETKYSYHLQTKTGRLIYRWDNAPHHRDIPTFPHHKHIGSEKSISPTEEVTFEQIFKVVTKHILKKKK
jgi:hypothetical protein